MLAEERERVDQARGDELALACKTDTAAQAFRAQIEDLRVENTRLTVMAEVSRPVIEEEKRRVGSLENELAELRGQLSASSVRETELALKSKLLETDRDRDLQERKDADDAREALQASVSRGEVAKDEGRLRELREDLSMHHRKLEESEKRLTDLRAELAGEKEAAAMTSAEMSAAMEASEAGRQRDVAQAKDRLLRATTEREKATHTMENQLSQAARHEEALSALRGEMDVFQKSAAEAFAPEKIAHARVEERET